MAAATSVVRPSDGSDFMDGWNPLFYGGASLSPNVNGFHAYDAITGMGGAAGAVVDYTPQWPVHQREERASLSLRAGSVVDGGGMAGAVGADHTPQSPVFQPEEREPLPANVGSATAVVARSCVPDGIFVMEDLDGPSGDLSASPAREDVSFALEQRAEPIVIGQRVESAESIQLRMEMCVQRVKEKVNEALVFAAMDLGYVDLIGRYRVEDAKSSRCSLTQLIGYVAEKSFENPTLRKPLVRGYLLRQARAEDLRTDYTLTRKGTVHKIPLLHAAVCGKDLGLLQDLLEHGADRDRVNEYGLTAYDSARALQKKDSVTYTPFVEMLRV